MVVKLNLFKQKIVNTSGGCLDDRLVAAMTRQEARSAIMQTKEHYERMSGKCYVVGSIVVSIDMTPTCKNTV